MVVFLTFEQHLSQGWSWYVTKGDARMTAHAIWLWSGRDNFFQPYLPFNLFRLHALQIITPKISHNAKDLASNWLQCSNYFSPSEACQALLWFDSPVLIFRLNSFTFDSPVLYFDSRVLFFGSPVLIFWLPVLFLTAQNCFDSTVFFFTAQFNFLVTMWHHHFHCRYFHSFNSPLHAVWF